MSRLLDWEKAIANTISTVNMLDIFTASVNKELIETIQVLEEHDSALPDKLQQLLENKLKIKANCESQAKSLQHTTDILSWLLAETILTRRDTVLKSSPPKLSEISRNILRLQPFTGPYLFNGKVDEVMKRDGEQTTSSLILSLSQDMKNKQRFSIKTTTMITRTTNNKLDGPLTTTNKFNEGSGCFFKGNKYKRG